MKYVFLLPAMVMALPLMHGATTSWADPYGRHFTPTSTWTQSSSQGVFAIAPRNEESATPPAETAPAQPTGPAMSLSITASGLLDFVFQQLYSSFSGEEADRIRAVLAPQYEEMAMQLQSAFGGADMVGYPDQPPPGTPPPADTTLQTGPAAPVSTSSLAVVAATSLLINPEPVMSGASANTNLLASFVTVPFDSGTTVPEPSTWALLVAGLGVAAWRSRR
jgi:hypothetical protein